jgi:hypothetical protein
MNVYAIRFSKHGTIERLVLEIHERRINRPYDTPCFYEVTYEQYPLRLVVDLDSSRSEFTADFPNFAASDYISGEYSLLSYDWGNYLFALTLKKSIKFEVFELHNPARIGGRPLKIIALSAPHHAEQGSLESRWIAVELEFSC